MINVAHGSPSHGFRILPAGAPPPEKPEPIGEMNLIDMMKLSKRDGHRGANHLARFPAPSVHFIRLLADFLNLADANPVEIAHVIGCTDYPRAITACAGSTSFTIYCIPCDTLPVREPGQISFPNCG
jgi:hypothetical protein